MPLRLALLAVLLAVPAQAQLTLGGPDTLRLTLRQGEADTLRLTLGNPTAAPAPWCLDFDDPLGQGAPAAAARTGAGNGCGTPGALIARTDSAHHISSNDFVWLPAGHDPADPAAGPRLLALAGLDDLFVLDPATLGVLRSADGQRSFPFGQLVGLYYDPVREAVGWVDTHGDPVADPWGEGGVDSSVVVEAYLAAEQGAEMEPTGRRVRLPVVGPFENAEGAFESGYPGRAAYDPTYDARGLGGGTLYVVDHVARTLWAFDWSADATAGDTAAAVLDGYPVSLRGLYAKPTFLGLDAFGRGEHGTGRIEMLYYAYDTGEEAVGVADRYGRRLGLTTPLPRGVPHNGNFRDRADPNGRMYVGAGPRLGGERYFGVHAYRPAPLSPSWVTVGDGSLSAWRGTVAPGAEAEVALAVSAAGLAVGRYRVAVLVERADGSQQAEVEVELTVEPGVVAAEGGPEAGGSEEGPSAFSVGAPYPNPASGAVAVPVTLAEPAAVMLAVYDVLGRRVAGVTSRLPAGTHDVTVDVSPLPPGAYVYRVEAAGAAPRTGRLTLVR